jgi:hypothetical protein
VSPLVMRRFGQPGLIAGIGLVLTLIMSLTIPSNSQAFEHPLDEAPIDCEECAAERDACLDEVQNFYERWKQKYE